MEISFNDLNLSEHTLNAITKKGFKNPSEIQAKVIPIVLEGKSDIIGIAQTGTGKTGAFGLPLVDLVGERNKLPQAIILAPTRELALQVTSELEMFSGNRKLKVLTVYGGASINAQVKELRRGVDIVVGTPGRVVDLLNRGDLVLKESSYFILDEADEMLKMGFIEDIEFILDSSSKKRRVYLFSATMPDRIKQLSKKYMKKQEIIEVEKKKEINNLIEQKFYKSRQSEKFEVLRKIIDMEDFFYAIVFCRTKADVDNVTASLKKAKYDVDCIHGDIAQNRREKILKRFRDLKLNILVATDVAARGIDVENLTHIINYSLPEDVETYTHRIGRTGRAGNFGNAISLVSPAEMRKISAIERELKIKLKPLKLLADKEIKLKNENKFLDEIDKIVEKVDVTQNIGVIDQLLEKHDHIRLIGALLHKLDNNKESSNFKDNTKNDSRNNFSDNEMTRIFIAKGRMDKMDKKGLVHFIEKESRVKLSVVKDVKVCEKFSFLTLKSQEANDVVDFFESLGKRSIAEIAK